MIPETRSQSRSEAGASASHQPLDSLVHRTLLVSAIQRGFPFSYSELAVELRQPIESIAESLRRLESNHGVVLHPGTLEPWVAHPFSFTPTLFYVTAASQTWWAPCIWCALGVSTLVNQPV